MLIQVSVSPIFLSFLQAFTNTGFCFSSFPSFLQAFTNTGFCFSSFPSFLQAFTNTGFCFSSFPSFLQAFTWLWTPYWNGVAQPARTCSISLLCRPMPMGVAEPEPLCTSIGKGGARRHPGWCVCTVHPGWCVCMCVCACVCCKVAKCSTPCILYCVYWVCFPVFCVLRVITNY